jgi:TPR repeat protein
MMSNLAIGLDLFNQGNYVQAFAALLPIAEAGDAEAQCLIANLYQVGWGVDRNIVLAIKWYEKSANQGYGVASNNLSEIFFAGENGSIETGKAMSWRGVAIEQGFKHSREME